MVYTEIMKKVWRILGVIFLGMLAFLIVTKIIEAIIAFLALLIFYPIHYTSEERAVWSYNVTLVTFIFGTLFGLGAWYYIYYLLIGKHKKKQ